MIEGPAAREMLALWPRRFILVSCFEYALRSTRVMETVSLVTLRWVFILIFIWTNPTQVSQTDGCSFFCSCAVVTLSICKVLFVALSSSTSMICARNSLVNWFCLLAVEKQVSKHSAELWNVGDCPRGGHTECSQGKARRGVRHGPQLRVVAWIAGMSRCAVGRASVTFPTLSCSPLSLTPSSFQVVLIPRMSPFTPVSLSPQDQPLRQWRYSQYGMMDVGSY